MLQNDDRGRASRKSSDVSQQRWRFWLWYVFLMLMLLWVWQETTQNLTTDTIPYSEFKELLRDKRVEEVVVTETDISGSYRPRVATPQEGHAHPRGRHTFRTIRVEDPNLTQQMLDSGVMVVGSRPSFLAQFLWAWLLPIGLILMIWVLIFKRMGKAAGQSVLSIGKSRAKLVSENETSVTFDDVAGAAEAKQELQEIVDFLRDSRRYERLGARIPKGVLLVGPPGTGKTLLARAVAGEAKVPFFSIAGSDFVEMFVGVGAARVRDLFQQAVKQAPCIIFIDELDAIGRQRSAGFAGAVNDEREQTLNQLLAEMDGFAVNQGVIVLAATNRPEVLDRALLRPGRFDRQVVVDAPDVNEREAILKVHVRHKPLHSSVNLRKIAQGTPGFSGADLANAVNEAALLAVRRNHVEITHSDLEEAVEKVVAGPERKSRRLGSEEKRLVAFHEVGHALVATYSPHAEPVHKISIVPRGRAALGYTLQLPVDEQYLVTRAELLDKIAGLLGGRAAEELVFNEITTGSENDLDKASIIARQMVCIFGMSEKVGLAHVGRPDSPLFLRGREGGFLQDCSPETARLVDEEVRRILDEGYEQAKEILTEHRSDLEKVANYLLEEETIDATTFMKMIKRDKEPKNRLFPRISSGADRGHEAALH